jgi:dCMP deaminase
VSKISWDDYFVGMLGHVASKSGDLSTKVGCIIVGPDNEPRSTGYNDFPRGVDDNDAERRQRPEKYFWTEHAERNAIYNAARVGVPLKGCRAYVDLFPCMDCARGLVQSGIVEVICTEQPDNPRWGESQSRASRLFAEVGVPVRFVQKSADRPVCACERAAERRRLARQAA